MSMMYVLLPLAMLGILLALGALFWLSRVKVGSKSSTTPKAAESLKKTTEATASDHQD
ncbi:hypothetical protein [Shewanella mangrovi]|uniref:hypothetical protein n=1 Tax=Shewanella mangrovi TaxID=1515746 RepID=UPI000AC7F3FC|nr:hypothetical protein [Shewanella mangrovi]